MLKEITKSSDFTFKFNKSHGRHGWLRLTPAYSVKLVKNILSTLPPTATIFEPFSGTATTGLVCAEEGYICHCNDINPFLIWLGNAKCRKYSHELLNETIEKINEIETRTHEIIKIKNWIPALFKIERWWPEDTLNILAALRQSLADLFGEAKISENPLPWIAFCRLVIETSSAAFNHVSMSFGDKSAHYEFTYVIKLYNEILRAIIASCKNNFSGNAFLYEKNSIDHIDDHVKFDTIITSPPYPNRMSYIRELRPYMYWTQFLTDAREAGELDWQSVGGTWGIATSHLSSWEPIIDDLPDSFYKVEEDIKGTKQKNSAILSRYVFKYLHDMHLHFSKILSSNNRNISLHYIIGNSAFYGILVDTPRFFIDSLNALGFINARSSIIRKRNCNKLLYEYIVSANL